MADKTFEDFVEERAAVTIADADEFVVRDDSAADVKKITSSSLKTAMGLQHNGSAANPSYSFSFDSDTGIYRAGANQLGFAAGGVELLSVGSTDVNVTTGHLNLISNTGAQTMSLGEWSSGFDYAAVETPSMVVLMGNASDVNSQGFMRTKGTGALSLGTNNSTDLTIANGGNVGIGTTSPSEMLHIKGDGAGLRIEDGSATDHYNILRNDSTGFLDLSGSQTTYSGYNFKVNNGTTALTIANSGAVSTVGDITAGGDIITADGSSAAPSHTFASDPNSGVYLHGADRVGIATGGAYRLIADSGGIIINGAVETGSGSAATTAHSFNGDPDTGMFRAATDQLAFAAGGTQTILTKSSQTKINATSTQALIVDTTAAAGPYIDLSEHGARVGYIGFPGSSAFYLQNDRAGGFYRMPQMGALTTASAANVFFNTSNSAMYRSTSSLRYKTDVEDLDLDTAMRALDMRPIWYRSLGDDRKDWSFYGLGAEEVAEVDPRLVEFAPTPDCECSLHLVSHPIVEDGEPFEVDDRNLEDHTDDCLQPLNVQYSRLVPHLIRIAQDQRDQLIEIKATVTSLQSRIAALEGLQ